MHVHRTLHRRAVSSHVTSSSLAALPVFPTAPNTALPLSKAAYDPNMTSGIAGDTTGNTLAQRDQSTPTPIGATVEVPTSASLYSYSQPALTTPLCSTFFEEGSIYALLCTQTPLTTTSTTLPALARREPTAKIPNIYDDIFASLAANSTTSANNLLPRGGFAFYMDAGTEHCYKYTRGRHVGMGIFFGSVIWTMLIALCFVCCCGWKMRAKAIRASLPK